MPTRILVIDNFEGSNEGKDPLSLSLSQAQISENADLQQQNALQPRKGFVRSNIDFGGPIFVPISFKNREGDIVLMAQAGRDSSASLEGTLPPGNFTAAIAIWNGD